VNGALSSMKIALLTNSFLPHVGGAEYVIHHLARVWGLAGHEVTVITVAPGDAPELGIPYSVKTFKLLRGSSRLGYHRFPFLQLAVRTLSGLLESYKPDFISAHFGYPVGLWLARCSPIPRFVITCHGEEINPGGKPRSKYHLDRVLAESFNRAHGVIAISNYSRKLMEQMGVRSDKIHLIPNGIDRKQFRKPVEFDLRVRFGIPKDAPVILSVGREHWIKAFDTGIEAIALLLKDIPDAHYVLLGRGNERWIPLVKRLNIERNVTISSLYGDELVGAYQQSDLFFSSSVYEGCPLVVLEAMASGLPAVVTNVSGSQDMIETGKNGIVVEPNRTDEMANALGSLMRDKSLQKRFGLANIELSKYYDWSNIGKMYLELA
jgi:glycosyltransferase involved in cell wall biosynthesis